MPSPANTQRGELEWRQRNDRTVGRHWFVTGERARQFGIQLRLLHEIHLLYAGLGVGESGVKA